MPVEQQIACPLAEVGIANHDRHNMRLVGQYRKSGSNESRLGRSHRKALTRTFCARCLEVGDLGGRSRGDRRRQGRRENESGSVGADSVYHRAFAGDVAAKRTKGLC